MNPEGSKPPQKPTRQESKADATDRAAREIMRAEELARDNKTADLRAARLAAKSKADAETPAAAKGKTTAKGKTGAKGKAVPKGKAAAKGTAEPKAKAGTKGAAGSDTTQSEDKS